MRPSPVLPPNFAPLGQDFAQNPYSAYAALRAIGEPVWFAPFQIWLIARHEDVLRVAQDHSMVRASDGLFSEQERLAMQRSENFHDMPHHERFVQTSLLDSDGPVHDRLRGVVRREFTPGRIARMRAETEAVVAARLDVLNADGGGDFVTLVARDIPGHVIGRMIGVPSEDCALLRRWSEDTVSYFDIDRTDEKKVLAERAVTEFAAYLTTLINARYKAPGVDFIDALIAAERSGELSRDELISLAMLILMAGHGSTIDVIGSALATLLTHPDALQSLRMSQALYPTAIQEMFRYESPLPFFHRYVTAESEVAGRPFKRGDKLGLLYGSANRDPLAFDEPDSFRLERRPNRHLAFGHGQHFCLGNHLARLEMEILFSTLLARFPTLALTEEPLYKTGLAVRGVNRLMVSL